jgi:ABC-type multidrug transport system ATPase subunit
LIRLTSIRKEYADRCVLDIRDACFAPGVRYAVMGANGSGKTTLLRIIAGIVKPDTGRIEFDNQIAIGYLPQRPYSFGFSVKKNIQIALPGKDHTEDTAMCALRSVGMEARASQGGGKLSGGEAQRLAVARVLATERPVLLLDEPTASADVGGTDLIEKAVEDYWERTTCTLIVSTHSPAQAMRMTDIVLFLHEGKIAEMGEPKQVLYEPKTPEVRAFLEHWRI